MAGGYNKGEDLHQELLNSIEQKVEVVSRLCLKWSIYHVPWRIRRLNDAAYSPHTISIGPLHSAEKKLKNMEAHKIIYMESIMRRTPNPNITMADCGKAIISLEGKARDCYPEKISCYDQKKLAETLLLDGCFILELFLRYSVTSPTKNPYHDDPIFGSPSMISALRRDLLLVENQIPFCVLQCLFDNVVKLIPTRQPSYSIWEYALLFFQLVNGPVEENNDTCEPFLHLLDLVHRFYQPSIPKMENEPESSKINSASKLADAGVQFKRRISKSLFDIEFTGGVLHIPQLCVDDMTEPRFRNLIAFEQYCNGRKQHITSYAFLMDCLVDTPQDVELLQQEEIITNNLGESKDVSKLFNNLCKEVVQIQKENPFSGQFGKVDAYCNKWWRKSRAFIKRKYFANPVKLAAFAIAVVALILTILQTVYIIITYYYAV